LILIISTNNDTVSVLVMILIYQNLKQLQLILLVSWLIFQVD